MPDVLFHLTDKQWDAIERFLPFDRSGPHQLHDRDVISGIVQVLQSACPWRLCPPEYGPYLIILNRYLEMSRLNLWHKTAEAIQNCPADPQAADISPAELISALLVQCSAPANAGSVCSAHENFDSRSSMTNGLVI